MSGLLLASVQRPVAAGPVSVAMSPTSQSLSGITTSKTFPSESVTVTNGTASSYNWYFTGASGGTFTINAGQGTAAANARVTGVAAPGTATATLKCDVVVNGVTYTASASLSYENTDTGLG